jgi:phospholipid/cholesterol/gamma-HCH transport system substrate-binding protein
MASIKTKFTVGLFVAIGLALVIVAVIWLGMSNYLEKGQLYTAYFDESVQGLGPDSPVKYRGVSIGRVTQIGVAPDATLIEVVMKIESDLQPAEIRSNMVAQLKSVGITGIMFIELDRKKPWEVHLAKKLSFIPKYPEVPTKPSDIQKIIQGVDGIIQKVNAIDFQGVVEGLKSSMLTLNQAIARADIEQLSKELRKTLQHAQTVLDKTRWEKTLATIDTAGSSFTGMTDQARKTIQRLDGLVAGNKKNLQEAIDGIKRSVRHMEQIAKNGNGLIENADARLTQMEQRLDLTLENVQRSTGELDRFMEQIADQPSQLLFAPPPAPRRLDQK